MGDSVWRNSESSCFREEEKSGAGRTAMWRGWLLRRSSLAVDELGATSSKGLTVSRCAEHSRSIVGKSQVGLWVRRVTARLTKWEGGREKGWGEIKEDR
jgi:hypothetical protein